MITGFNTDVKHKNKVYHVQTEDKGRSNPKIESLVYVGGEILDSYQTSYEQNKADLTEDQIMELLESQHKRVVRHIKIGHYDEDEAFTEDIISNRDLDDVILEHLSAEADQDPIKLVVNGLSTIRKNATTQLKIETRRTLSQSPVAETQIRVKLVTPDNPPVLLIEGQTDQTGFLVTQVSMPGYPEGESSISILALSEFGTAEQRFPLRH
jgi:hypothetical protein